jgi:hypothetical protein
MNISVVLSLCSCDFAVTESSRDLTVVIPEYSRPHDTLLIRLVTWCTEFCMYSKGFHLHLKWQLRQILTNQSVFPCNVLM